VEGKTLDRIKLLSSNRQFLMLWIGLTQSQLGSLLNFIALTLYVYDMTQSGAAIGKLQISTAVPSLLVGLFAGVVVDRFNRKWIMVISDIVRGLLFLYMGFLPDLSIIYAILFGSALVSLFFGPAYSSSLPLILKKKGLMEANSLSEMTSQLVRVMGPGLASILYIQFGLASICFFNFATYLFSAVIIMTLAIPQPDREKGSWKNLRVPLNEAIDGFRHIRSHNLTRWVLFVNCGVYLGAGAIVVLMVVFAKEALNGSDSVFGLIVSATAFGSVVGAVATWFRGKLKDEIVLKVSLISLGVSVLLISATSTVWVALVLFAIVGIAQTTFGITVATLLQTHLAENIMGRTFATMGVITQVFQLLSMGTGAFLADTVGVRTVYIIGSSIILLTALLASKFVSVPVVADENPR
jgi:MFS family permease